MTTLPDGDGAVPEIGFDPEAVLERDSRVLVDRAFLETLHEELAAELAPGEAALVLFQMGFLHGLQDAIRVVAASGEAGAGGFVPPLRMPLRPRDPGKGSAALVIEGEWSERREASAFLSAFGATHAPACHLSAGYTSGWLSGTFGADLLAVESECSATGAGACRFVAREAAAWRDAGDLDAQAVLASLPYDAFRALVRERVARSARPGRAATHSGGGVDREAAAVHIWGPVMVIPWAGADATLHALGMLARDAGTAEVSVIVLDLQGALLDEAMDAVALEQLVQTSETWGTEVLFVDPSPQNAPLLADLEPPPLLTLKELEPAVALAFQIARSQRRAQ